jgi:hypothetical protein
MLMQRNYGRNQIPDLRKKSGIMEYIETNYLDPKSCMIIFTIIMVLVAGIMCVAAYPNSNVPMNV